MWSSSIYFFDKQCGFYIIRSDQISHSVVSDSLRPHESQHARPPCPSPTPGVHWDSRPSSHWCHPAISSSVVPFSSCPQSLPASESFPMSQLFIVLLKYSLQVIIFTILKCTVWWFKYIHRVLELFSSVQFSLVTQSCLTLCDPMNRSMPGLPVHHQLPELTQTHVHWVGDAIQPSHPLSSPSPPAPNPSQHQGFFSMSQLFAWGRQSFSFSISPSKEHPVL